MSDELLKDAKRLGKRIQAAEKEHGAADKSLSASARTIVDKKPPKLIFRGLMGSYMKIIKKAGSLTVTRPATLSATKAAERSPTEASVEKAVAELKKHLADLQKSGGSQKEFGDFKKNMTTLAKKAEALI